MSTAVLCIFARAPVLGGVKRRLAADIGEAAALRAHVRLVEDSLSRLRHIDGVRSELWIAGDPASAAHWAGAAGLELRVQQGGDLGERMRHALETGLGHADKALVVGCDCPLIDAAYVRAAVGRLDQHVVVLGPAEDGGYGLIGVRRGAAGLACLFRDMPWGTDRVLAQTLDRAERAGLATALLPTVWDVDDGADWQRYLALDRG